MILFLWQTNSISSRLFGFPLFQGSHVSEIVASNKRIIDSDIEEILPREVNLDIYKPGMKERCE